MKKISIIFSIATLFLFAATSCQPSKNNEEHEHEHSMSEGDSTKIAYTCSMHPEVISDEPGKCSKCGMELVKIENTDEGKEPEHMDSLEHK